MLCVSVVCVDEGSGQAWFGEQGVARVVGRSRPADGPGELLVIDGQVLTVDVDIVELRLLGEDALGGARDVCRGIAQPVDVPAGKRTAVAEQLC